MRGTKTKEGYLDTKDLEFKDMGFYFTLVSNDNRVILFNSSKRAGEAFGKCNKFKEYLHEKIEDISSDIMLWVNKSFRNKDNSINEKKIYNYFRLMQRGLAYKAREKEQQLIKLLRHSEVYECITNIKGKVFKEMSSNIINIVINDKDIDNKNKDKLLIEKKSDGQYYLGIRNDNYDIGNEILALYTTSEEFKKQLIMECSNTNKAYCHRLVIAVRVANSILRKGE